MRRSPIIQRLYRKSFLERNGDTITFGEIDSKRLIIDPIDIETSIYYGGLL